MIIQLMIALCTTVSNCDNPKVYGGVQSSFESCKHYQEISRIKDWPGARSKLLYPIVKSNCCDTSLYNKHCWPR